MLFVYTLLLVEYPLIRKLKQLDPDGFLQHLHALLMIDDTVIFATSCDVMKEKLRVLSEYCLAYKMVINQSKTKFITINAGDQSHYVHA